ncbi:MAG: NUDIX hydrolase [Nanoarchaeales archaeon]|nr:NUDIX hydrolase [Nanoarchaeales archaeon]
MKVIKTINLIILSPDKTKICLVKKFYDSGKHATWAFPGESIKGDESNKQAIERVIKDQMDCKVTFFKEFKKSETRAKIAVIKSQYLTGNISGEIKLDKRKYSDFNWFDLNEDLLKLDYAFNEKMIVEKLLKEYKK